MMKMSGMAWLVAALAAAGCGGKKDGGGASASGASGSPKTQERAAPAPAPSGSDPFGAWDMDARTQAWQGAWSGDGAAIGMKAAWLVEGTKVTYSDGKSDQTLELTINSPCTATMTAKAADGSSSGTVSAYTIKDGALITGLGDAGSRKGASAVVCGGSAVFTLDDKGCTAWHDDFGKLTSEPGECGIRQDKGKDVFWYKDMGTETVDEIDGDVIWSEQMRTHYATKQPDLRAAKKAAGF